MNTFKSWPTGGSFGIKTEYDNGTEFVCEIWCKLCAKRTDEICKESCIRGQALLEIDRYTVGTNFVKKFSVERLLNRVPAGFQRMHLRPF